MVDSMKLLRQENLFSRKLQNMKVIRLIMWTYDICAADTGTYYEVNDGLGIKSTARLKKL